MDNWINVKDKMPPDFHEVMFFYIIDNEFTKEIIKKDIVCGHYANNLWHICYLFCSMPLQNVRVKVTHWMELPNLPI